MPSPHPEPTPQLSLLATLTPPTPTRAWLTSPHPTAPLLATCCTDKTVRVYSLTTHTLLSTISGGHKRSIRSCAWKPNLKGESVLATGSFDASVGIWRRYDKNDDDGLNPRPIDIGAKGVDFDTRDKDIENNAEEEEDDEEWRFAIVLDGHESEVKSVAWSTGGNLLATCSRDKSVWIWEEVGEDDYETIAVLQEHEGDVKCVAWHPEEELLASASYDDEVRLWREDVDDWGCCGVLRGHGGTVWGVGWEGVEPHVRGGGRDEEGMKMWMERREKSGPRLLSCSDDLTVRVWRRRPKEKVQQSRLSIIRSGSVEEDWVEEARLPVVHERPIYAVAWSKSGRVVSTGGDGAVVVYEERWKAGFEAATKQAQTTENDADGKVIHGNTTTEPSTTEEAEPMEGVTKPPEPDTPAENNANQQQSPNDDAISATTEWVVVAKMESAHDVFEINHVAWAPRPSRKGESNSDQEDLIVTTGDDGVVKVWSLDV